MKLVLATVYKLGLLKGQGLNIFDYALRDPTLLDIWLS